MLSNKLWVEMLIKLSGIKLNINIMAQIERATDNAVRIARSIQRASTILRITLKCARLHLDSARIKQFDVRHNIAKKSSSYSE